MTKTLKTITLSLLVALCVCFGFTAVANFSAYATGDMKASLNVGNDISLIVYSEIAAASDVKATFNWTGKEEYSDVVYGEKQGDTNTYKFTYKGLSAQYMAKTVTVTVFDGETAVAQKTVSVKELLEGYASSTAKTLGINSNAYKKLKTLSADILNYGKAAEAYLGMTDDIGTVTGGTAYVADETAQTIVKGDLKWNAGVIFDYNLQPAAKVYIPAEAYKDTLVAKFNGNVVALEATEKSGVYLVKYTEYNILTVDDAYTFEVFDGETSLGSLTTSFAALAKTSNADIVKAALVYGKSVVKYDFVLEDIDYVSDHIQAENAITGGTKNTGSYSWQYTTTEGTVTTGSGKIAIGAEGQFVENLSKKTTWTIALNMTAPKAGEYDLRAMMQVGNNRSLNSVFRIAVKQNDEEVTDVDYAENITSDYCFPATQWSTGGYSKNNGWRNNYFWTDASLATVTLAKGNNTIYITAKSATTDNIPNIDYLYVKGFTAKEDNSVKVVNARASFSTSPVIQSEIGKTEETAFLIQKGIALKELFKYNGGYVNGMTGLYMIIPGYVISDHGETYKVPVTESMISGLNVHEAGIQKATIAYGKYSAEVYFNVYGSVIEAEDNVFMLDNGAETDTKYTRKEKYTQAEYYEGDTKKQTSLYNAFNGVGMATNFDTKETGNTVANYKLIYFKFKVTVPETGKYNLNIRAQLTSDYDTSIKEKFSVNINEATDENGTLVFTKNTVSQNIYRGNQLKDYADIGDKSYTKYYNMFWWSVCKLGTFELNKGENTIRIRMVSLLNANIDCFEVTYADTAVPNATEQTSIFSMRNRVKENLDGKVLTIKKGQKLTDAVKTPEKHPVKYTLLYLHTSTGKEIPVLGSMLEGKVDYNKVGEEQVVTVTDPVSGESASFTLLIEE